MRVALIALFCVVPSTFLWSTEMLSSDENGDGKPDRWFILEGETLSEYSADRNYDGVVDHRVLFDEEGKTQYEELDFNWDGAMDDFYFYRSGVLIRKEIDSNYDNLTDVWVHIVDGVYVEKIEQDQDFDGVIDKIIEYGKD